MGLLAQQQQLRKERRARERQGLIEVENPGAGFLSYWRGTGVDGTAQTVVADGPDDMVYGGTFLYHVYAITAGDTSGGSATLDNGGSVDLYDDGTDVLTLACAANGTVTVQRTGGADTFDVVLQGVWQ